MRQRRGCVVWTIWGMIFINRRFGTGNTFCVMLLLGRRFSPQNGVLFWKKIRGVIFVMLALSADETIWNAGGGPECTKIDMQLILRISCECNLFKVEHKLIGADLVVTIITFKMIIRKLNPHLIRSVLVSAFRTKNTDLIQTK